MPACVFCMLLELAERMRAEGPLAALADYVTPDQKAAAAELLRERPPELERHARAAAGAPLRTNRADEMLITVLVRVAQTEGVEAMQASFCPQHRVLCAALANATGLLEQRADQMRRRRQN